MKKPIWVRTKWIYVTCYEPINIMFSNRLRLLWTIEEKPADLKTLLWSKSEIKIKVCISNNFKQTHNKLLKSQARFFK